MGKGAAGREVISELLFREPQAVEAVRNTARKRNARDGLRRVGIESGIRV